jgi:type II secretory ATPase GspE/PulE/Tfp pilus assembly ATPase PilB-like protein
MVGDIRSSDKAFGAFDLAQSGRVVVATLRIPTAASAFGRLVDMGLDPRVVAEKTLASFGVRLLAGVNGKCAVFERLAVSAAVRRLIASAATSSEIVHQAVAEGMKTLRQRALDLVADGLVKPRSSMTKPSASSARNAGTTTF